MDRTTDSKEIDFSARDITILKARLKYPRASVRELEEVLDDEYDISLSHNRINDILRELKSEGLFRFFAVPDESLFEQYLFRVSFHYPETQERWGECRNDLIRDPHVVLFFSTQGYHHWQFITQFRSSSDSEKWKEQFFTKHGDIIAEIEKTKFRSLHKFKVDATIFDEVLQEREQGKQYLESSK